MGGGERESQMQSVSHLGWMYGSGQASVILYCCCFSMDCTVILPKEPNIINATKYCSLREREEEGGGRKHDVS